METPQLIRKPVIRQTVEQVMTPERIGIDFSTLKSLELRTSRHSLRRIQKLICPIQACVIGKLPAITDSY